jgi:UDP-N-acetylmuramyl pentapeptide synthase
MKIGFYINLNKLITKGCKLFKKNGAQLPGYFVYDVFKQKDILEHIKYPKIVIAVTGSSGKGTTCTLIKHILEDANLSVSYNDSGNNGVLGVTTHILNNCDAQGNFKKDALILECDERHLKLIFKHNKPTHMIITNITRDQPARNGNPEIIFDEINKCLDDSVHLIINADDPLVSRMKLVHNGAITTYGISKIKGDYIKNDLNNVDFAYCPICHKKLNYEYYHYGHIGNYSCPSNDFERGKVDYEASNVNLSKSYMKINNKMVNLNKNALYNAYATLAAYSCCSTLSIPENKILYALNNDKIEAKRGKTLYIQNRPITMLESKNENNLSYYQSIKYITDDPDKKVVILGFENVSRRYKLNDLSWLYDVDFEHFNKDKTIEKFYLIGRFRYDVATRLNYAKIDAKKIVLVDNIDNLINIVKKTSKGKIYTMVCFDMTQKIKELVNNENN